MDGAVTGALLWRVVVPVIRPTLGVLLVFFFIWTWNEYHSCRCSSWVSNQTTPFPFALGTLQGQNINEPADTSGWRRCSACSPRHLLPHLPSPDPGVTVGARQLA